MVHEGNGHLEIFSRPQAMRDFKIGHDGRLGQLDAYTGGLKFSI